jgi:hypothetical protein
VLEPGAGQCYEEVKKHVDQANSLIVIDYYVLHIMYFYLCYIVLSRIEVQSR